MKSTRKNSKQGSRKMSKKGLRKMSKKGSRKMSKKGSQSGGSKKSRKIVNQKGGAYLITPVLDELDNDDTLNLEVKNLVQKYKKLRAEQAEIFDAWKLVESTLKYQSEFENCNKTLETLASNGYDSSKYMKFKNEYKDNEAFYDTLIKYLSEGLSVSQDDLIEYKEQFKRMANHASGILTHCGVF